MKKYIPESLRRAWRVLISFFAALRFGFPSRKLIIIGVTGTSGKSTTANLIYHILDKNNLPAGVISTVGVKAGKKVLDTGLHVTTPDPIQLQKLLRYLANKKVKYVVLEASSHGLAQGRIGLTKFDYAVYTNIKRDHLDWHGSWENYAKAKAILARRIKTEGKIFINRDDKDMYDFLQKELDESLDKNILTYSMKEISELEETAIGTRFMLNGQQFILPILGAYNVENALAAINVAKEIGLSYEEIAASLKTFMGLEGRMQVMQPSPFAIIVDFAHNTDSLIKSLQTAKKLTSYKGRVITVFGSAGLRDIEKRYTMGEAAGELADIIIVTAEDPRTESLEKINSQIIEGAMRQDVKLIARFKNHKEYEQFIKEKMSSPTFEVERKSVFAFDEESTQSRYDAIEFAIRIAREGDVVITEGKGHEQSLCFGTTEYPFSDQDAVDRALRERE
ncbi:MAG: UDP-N-acetylmuramoyl-L-alanyl-D-glutamate--2,6-diaminopimelate ligase [Candidatus Dojkabacteria bacterium]